MAKAGKVAYLDGIRGVAAFMVFCHHFLLAFYTAHFTNDVSASHLKGMEIRYGQSIFSFITNGNFMVCIFFVLSGYVLSRKYLRSGDFEVLRSAAYRRFVRLYVPVASVMILSYLMYKAGMFVNVAAAKVSHSDWWLGNLWIFPEPPLQKLWHCLKVHTMFLGDATFDTSLWTMSIELTGSFFVFAFLALTHGSRNRLFMLLVIIAYTKITEQAFLGAFALGMSFSYIEAGVQRISKVVTALLAPLLLLTGCFLGSFPTNFGDFKGSVFDKFPAGIMQYQGWFHIVGAYLLILSFVIAPVMQRVVSMRLFRFLGYISFTFYLLHPLVIGSFSSYLLLHMYERFGYNHSMAAIFPITTVVTIAASWAMTRYIDEPGVRLSKYIYSRWFQKKAAPVPELQSIEDNSK